MRTSRVDSHATLPVVPIDLLRSLTMLALAATWGMAAFAADPPAVTWTHQFGTTEVDFTAGIAVRNDGTSFAAGYTMGELEDGVAAGGFDVFVQAIGPDGAPSWARQFGSSDEDFAEAIAIGPEGRIAVVGQTDGALAGPSAGQTDGFLVVLDAQGVTLWEHTLGTPAEDVASAVTFRSDGSLVVAGWTGGDFAGPSAGGEDAFLIAFDEGGAERWRRQFGSAEDDRLRDVATDETDVVAVAGQTRGALGGAPGGGWDAFLRRHDADGAPIGTNQFGGELHEYAYAVAFGPDGGLVAAGAGPSSEDDRGAEPAFVRAFDPAGSERWSYAFGPTRRDMRYGLAVTADGSAFVVGGTEGDVAGEVRGIADAFLIALDPNGELRWDSQFGSDAFDGAHGVVATRDGLRVVGTARGPIQGATVGVIGAGGFVRAYDVR
ncbi:MAG: hypothetical protein U5K81_10460 [Trueperaceae bacterium]|nr:hypothetical protein [Trueperaceae bacterium]